MGNNQSSSSSSHHHRSDSNQGGGVGGSSSSSSMMKPSGSTSSLRSRSSTLDSNSRTMIDGGFLEPQSLLYSQIEYHRPTVHKLVLDRRLSPFYLGLNDFEPEWEVEEIVKALQEGEEQATRNLKDAFETALEQVTEAETQQINQPTGTRKHKEATQALSYAIMRKERLAEMIKIREKRGGGGLQWTSKTDQARLYKECALECPICFLYYPPNMVHTRCCDQPICTECFVQIKRAEPTPTHLESEPAACPFCMEPNFGCVYEKPAPTRPVVQQINSGNSGSSSDSPASVVPKSPKPRRKSFAHTEKEVVTTDMLHPDWESKLEAMKATVARRANRRIVFRQVGDRLIPVGITSGRQSDGANATMATTQTLPPDFLTQIAAALDHSNNNNGNEGQSSGGGGSRFRVRGSRRRGGSNSHGGEGGGGNNDEVSRLLEQLGLGGGPDLEEMMLQEAMRLSQLEEEERQKKIKREEEEAEQKKTKLQTTANGAASSEEEGRRRNSTERALTEAMGGTVSNSHSPTTTTFPHTSSSSSPPSSGLSSIPPPSSSSTQTQMNPSSSYSSNPPSNATTPTTSTFPSSSRAPTLPPIISTSTDFDPLGPSVSRASETSSFVPASPNAGYQPLEDESDVESTNQRERKGDSRQSGNLIDI
ncbi:Sip5p [Sporobolomyces salmoneus]|uniref:Sip5p n=1 Tax=Sporobolomyces salmoneus TaxID=183962 RepID=UPI00318124A3